MNVFSIFLAFARKKIVSHPIRPSVCNILVWLKCRTILTGVAVQQLVGQVSSSLLLD